MLNIILPIQETRKYEQINPVIFPRNYDIMRIQEAMHMEPQEQLVFDIEKDPYNYVMRVVFCRWKPFILQAMDSDEVTNFSRFIKQLPITQKVLSQNLKALEQDGLVMRTVIPETPPRTEYRLTDRGKTLIPILDQVYDWGWHVMKEEGLPIDALGEMWHGYRDRDDRLMYRS